MSKTQQKEEKRTKSSKERESTLFRATAELLSAVSPPLSQQHLGGSATLFNLCMSLPCQAPTIFLPQFVTDLSPKPPSLTHFDVCVSILVWVLAFMFVFQSEFRAMFVFRYGFRRLCLCFGMDFRLGFKLCLHFGFMFRAWVSTSLYVSS